MHKILCSSASFLSRVITGDESWIYDYDSDTRQQSPQWKSPNSPRPKKARQGKSKVKRLLIILFDIEGIVQKEFILAGQTQFHILQCRFTATV
jgi:hypothetical protein